MPDYGFLNGFDNLGQDIAGLGKTIQANRDKTKQEKNDQDYLNWLSGVTQPKAPVSIPAPPQLAYGQHTGDEPVQGPALPAGRQEPDPSVTPTDMSQGLPGGAPFSNDYLQNPNSLIEAQKTKADQANAALFEDPAKTMNMLIEAKKHQVSPSMNSLLDFIAKQHEDATAHKFKSEESDKAAKARFAQEDARNKAATFRQEAGFRVHEKLADAANSVRKSIAAGNNATTLEATRLRGKKGPLDEQDIEAMTDDQLERLDQELSDEAAGVSQPEQAHYDSYDPLSMQKYREDYKDYTKTKQSVDHVQRLINRAQTLRKSAASGTPARSPASAPASAPTPQKRGVYNPATGTIEYK